MHDARQLPPTAFVPDLNNLHLNLSLTAGDEEARTFLPGQTRVTHQEIRVLRQRLLEQESAVNGGLRCDEHNGAVRVH